MPGSVDPSASAADSTAGQTALRVTSADEAHNQGTFGEAVDAVRVFLTCRLTRDAKAFADHRPGVPGCARLPYDLVDSLVRRHQSGAGPQLSCRASARLHSPS